MNDNKTPWRVWLPFKKLSRLDITQIQTTLGLILEVFVVSFWFLFHEIYLDFYPTDLLFYYLLIVAIAWFYFSQQPKPGFAPILHHRITFGATPQNYVEGIRLCVTSGAKAEANIQNQHNYDPAPDNAADDAPQPLTALTYQELLHNLCQQMITAFPAEACLIANLDQAKNALDWLHYCARPNAQKSATPANNHQHHELFPLDIINFQTLQECIKTLHPAVIRLSESSIATPEIELLQQLDFRVFVAIPLTNQQNNVTSLLFLFAGQSQTFADNEIQLAQLFAHQGNSAIENARLYSQANQQLQRRVDELAALERVSRELSSTLDLNKILSLVLEEALRLTQADFGNVYFYNSSSDTLVGYKEQGRFDSSQEVNHAQVTSAKEGALGRVLHSGQASLIPDVSQDKNFVDLGRGTRSEVVVPIYYATQPVGVINLESKQPNFFNQDQLQYLEALANHAAMAIGNAQAFDQQRLEREQAGRRADQLIRLSELSNSFRSDKPLYEILEDIAYAIVETVGYDTVMISLVEDNPPMLHHQVCAGIPLVQFEELQQPEKANPLNNLDDVLLDEFCMSNSYFIPVERKAVWHNKLSIPITEKDHAHARKFRHKSDTSLLANRVQARYPWQTGDILLIPLADTNKDIIGLLTVENPASGERPTLQSVQTLETFANYAATAIENAQLFELETKRRQLADTMRGVAEAISSQLDLDELLNIVLQSLSRVVEFDSASVQLLQKDELVIIGGHGWEDSQQVLGLSFSMGDNNPNRVVIETQEPLLIKNAHESYPDIFGSPIHHQIKSWLGVPLTYGTHVLGLMALDKHQANYFTSEDAEVVLAFANQVAVALQNSRLFEEARQQVQQLAALTEVAQSINKSLELNDVLNLMLDAVFDLVGERKGSIWLIDSNTNLLKIANTKNIPDFLVDLFNESNISVDSEPFASVIQSGDILVIEGSAEEDKIAHYSSPLPDDVTYVPLKTEEGVFGILAIETVIHQPNMRELVTTLADLAAVAIGNANLLDNTRRRASNMQLLYNLGVEVSGVLDVRQVMQSIIRTALELSDTQVGAMLFWDDQAGHYLIEGAAVTDALADKFGLAQADWLETKFSQRNPLGLWSDFIKQMLDTNQPIVADLSPPVTRQLGRAEKIAKRLGIQSILGVPIPVQNEIHGAIFVSTLSPRLFKNDDVQSLSLVANQASAAVRNAQLVQRLNLLTEELEERVELRTQELAQTLQDLTEERDRVEVLYEIGRELSTSFDMDRVLTEALHLINRAIGISLGSILLIEPGTEKLIYRAALGRDHPLPRGGMETDYYLGYGLAGMVMESREARIVPTLEEDPDWIPGKTSENHQSALAVPLITGDDVVGALLLFHPDRDYFTEEQLRLVTAASTQIAISVNNAELYRLITDQAERLGVMYRQQSAEAAKNQAILKGIADGVLVLDTNRNIVLVNPKAAEILNIDAEAVENQPLQQLLGLSGSPVELELTRQLYENLQKALKELEQGAHSAQFRIEVQPKAVLASLTAVALGMEEIPSIVAVLRDVSREAEIERIRNEFISTVSHELRTPMTSIKGYTDLLLSNQSKIGELNPTQERFIGIIQSNANRLTDLVNDILEISRIETGRIKLNFTSLNIIEVIKEIAVTFDAPMAEKALSFNLKLPNYLPNIYSDKARLTQVLVNLIGNAWQYTPNGGTINVYAKVAGDFIQIDVEDTGIGIVEQDVEYIFDRFFRSERTEVQVVDGTGLGLSITRSFVEMLGGKIWVKSQVDVGSVFSFTIPIDQQQGGKLLIDDLNRLAAAQIVIVSNDVPVVNQIKDGFEEQGYQTVVLNNKNVALDFMQEVKDSIGMIWLDIALSDSFELLQQLDHESIAVDGPLILSSFLVDENNSCLFLQVVDYIITSGDPSDIIEHTNLTLDKIRADMHQLQLPGAKHRNQLLLIESDANVSNRLRKLLVDADYKVQCAYNGKQALDMVVGNRPDLILLSSNIPKINGDSLLYQLRYTSNTKDIPIIMMLDDHAVGAKKEGVTFLSMNDDIQFNQPVSVDKLITQLEYLTAIKSD